VKLIIHFHPEPWLRMNGAILQFPQYVFMAWSLIKQDIVLTNAYARKGNGSSIIWS
jgi:hypothetical protein